MRFWRSVLLLLLSLSVSLIVFLGVSIDAHAALSGGTFMTAVDSLSVFGSSIPAKFYNGSGYTDFTFQYSNTMTLGSVNPTGISDYLTTGVVFLHYTASASGVSNDRSYITVDISPSYSIFDTSQLHSCIALSTGVDVTNVWQAPSWDWYWGGSNVHLENQNLISNTYRAVVRFDNYNTAHGCTFVVADFNSQSLTSGYSIRANFYGNTPDSGVYHLFIGVPYVDAGSTGTNGTLPATTAPPDINVDVNVDVDMSETNGILSTISGILSGLVDGIKGLFVPDSAWLSAWYASMVQALYDAFGDIPELNDQITTSIQNLINASAIENFQWPGVNVPGVGQISAPRLVPLKPNPVEFGSLYSFIRIAVNIVATCLVVNMLINKIKAVLVGEVVVSDGD